MLWPLQGPRSSSFERLKQFRMLWDRTTRQPSEYSSQGPWHSSGFPHHVTAGTPIGKPIWIKKTLGSEILPEAA
eukprot:7739245-Alexandrium_andersonii.AAC.1